jgi:RNA polymerase sigma factor (sigma-70 family)
MRDDSILTDLVTSARHGDQHAWNTLVERCAPLVVSICRRYRLGRADTEDVAQTVWLRLVDQLAKMRDPAALEGWIATTTGRECVRIQRAARPFQTASCDADTGYLPETGTEPAGSQLLAAERRAALRQAFACLPPSCQQLLAILTEDPPVPDAQISARLGIPVGSIGPTRRQCLQKLRDHPAFAALIHAEIPAQPGSLDQPAPPLVPAKLAADVPARRQGTVITGAAGQRPLPRPHLQLPARAARASQPSTTATPPSVGQISTAS